MRSKAALRILVFLLAAFPSVVLAQRFVVQRLCFARELAPPPLKPFPIPVGCEIIDCCPGCPGVGPLDWRIQIDGRVLQGAVLTIEGMDAAELKRVNFSGNARLVGDRILLQRGISMISALPASGSDRVRVGSLAPEFDKAAATRLESAAQISKTGGGDTDAAADQDNIVVQQLLGSVVVNVFHWRSLVFLCPRPVFRRDRLRVQNISGGDNVVVLMDSRTASGSSGCSDDRVLRTTNIINFGNILSASGCNSEVAVFAANNRMEFQTPVNTWTNAIGDLHSTPLQAIVNMPVSVWIANNGAAAQAVNDVANANLLYAQNKIGVQFAATQNNVSGNPTAVTTIGTVSCGAVGAIQGSAFYTPNALNIYYVNNAFTGENCARTTPIGDGNISYMGTLANLASLTHEIGHAFGLRPAGQGGHTNGLAGFGDNNIMWGGGPPTRDVFTLGQAFRMNTHTDVWGGTMLINDGLRAGPGRACPPLTTTTTCPALAVDWARP
jgi:hypothetical protein